MLQFCQDRSNFVRLNLWGGSLTHNQEKTPAALPKSDRGHDTPMKRSPAAANVNAASHICLSDTRPDSAGDLGQLFAVPVTLSPRLAWLDKHRIDIIREGGEWFAFTSRGGLPVEARGGTELDAEANLALKLGIGLWFEEAGRKEKA